VPRMAVLACLLVLLALPSAAGSADGFTITASPGPGRTGMTFTGPDGKTITHLDPGSYTIHVTDTSPERDFSLRGPGVSFHTGFMEEGTFDWHVTFVDGWYRYYDAAFEDDVHDQFTVGTPPAVTLKAAVTQKAVSLTDTAGAPVRHLDPGAYSIAVHDASTVDALRLIGPGVEDHTQVFSTTDYTWTVVLGDGRYWLYDERHPGRRALLTVGTPPPLSRAKLLHATTGPDFSMSMTDANWQPLTRLAAGTYRIVVNDTGRDHNFRLIGPGWNRATTVPFVGTRTWTVRLRPGLWFFRCDPHNIMFGTFVVVKQRR
jgi:hypothetical protein